MLSLPTFYLFGHFICSILCFFLSYPALSGSPDFSARSDFIHAYKLFPVFIIIRWVVGKHNHALVKWNKRTPRNWRSCCGSQAFLFVYQKHCMPEHLIKTCRCCAGTTGGEAWCSTASQNISGSRKLPVFKKTFGATSFWNKKVTVLIHVSLNQLSIKTVVAYYCKGEKLWKNIWDTGCTYLCDNVSLRTWT